MRLGNADSWKERGRKNLNVHMRKGCGAFNCGGLILSQLAIEPTTHHITLL